MTKKIFTNSDYEIAPIFKKFQKNFFTSKFHQKVNSLHWNTRHLTKGLSTRDNSAR